MKIPTVHPGSMVDRIPMMERICYGPVTEPGYYPVVSATDGVVERTGWLPLGGYRMGIRSPHGGYFYYAHLSEYDHSSRRRTGSCRRYLGYMGNTGYGSKGTKGRFPVHLHMGIYIKTPKAQEMSVDPYHILKMLQESTGRFDL